MKQTLREGEDLVTVARPTAPNQAVITEEDDPNGDFTFSGGGEVAGSAGLRIYDLSVPDNASENPVYEDLTTLKADDLLTAALTLDGFWTRDTIGYTFKHTLTNATYAFEGGHTYRVEYVLLDVTQKVGTIAHGDIYVDVNVSVTPSGSA